MDLREVNEEYYEEYLNLYFVRAQGGTSENSNNSLRNILYYHPYLNDKRKVFKLGNSDLPIILKHYETLLTLLINYLVKYDETDFVANLITETINMVINLINFVTEDNFIIKELDPKRVSIDIGVQGEYMVESRDIINKVLYSIAESKEKTELEERIKVDNIAAVLLRDARSQEKIPPISKPPGDFIIQLIDDQINRENNTNEEKFDTRNFKFARGSISAEKDIPLSFIGFLSNYDNSTKNKGMYERVDSINDFYFQIDPTSGSLKADVPRLKVDKDEAYIIEEKSGIRIPNSRNSLIEFFKFDTSRNDVEDDLDLEENTRYIIVMYELQKLFMETFDMDANESLTLMGVICRLFREKEVMSSLEKIASFFIYRKKYRG